MFLQFNISKRISWKLLNLRYSLLIARHKVTQKIKALQMYKNNKPLLVTYFWKYLCILTSRVWVRMLTRSWDSFQALSTLMVKFYSHLKLCAVLLGCRNEENNVWVFFLEGGSLNRSMEERQQTVAKLKDIFIATGFPFHIVPLEQVRVITGTLNDFPVSSLYIINTIYIKIFYYKKTFL